MKTKSASVVPRLLRLIPHFRKMRIGVLGDLMLDRYLWGAANRLSPEAPVPVVDFVSQTDCLGGAGNVAANLRGLGAQVDVFGIIGGTQTGTKTRDDDAGSVLRDCFRAVGIDRRGMLADPQRVTTVKTRVIARHQQIVRIDQERRAPLSPKTEEKLFRSILASLKKLDALVLSDYDKGLINDAFAERVLNACHQNKILVFVKPKTSRLYAYRGARAIVCNAKEAATYVMRPLSDEKSIVEAGMALLAQFGCAAVVITRTEHGMSVFEESSPQHLHIPATNFEVTYARVGQSAVERGATGRQVFDVTGAGDTVLSVFSLAVAAGANVGDAAILANTAAGVVVGKLGTAVLSPEELEAALHDIPPR
ncbi:MAG TPA: PfkB family carbohydrate kinase [Candidatus Acidoferrum sp.]|nr:PfkB family carbohydrate kinase [Candidatus Acidoferrum sp.]